MCVCVYRYSEKEGGGISGRGGERDQEVTGREIQREGRERGEEGQVAWPSVLEAVVGAAFVLQVVVTVLTHSRRRRDLQTLDL